MDEEKPRIKLESIQMLTEPGEVDCNARIGATERHFKDDLEGECCKCGAQTFYRPHPPYLCPFLCMDCGKPMLDAVAAGEAGVITTVESLKELHDWLEQHKNKQP